MEFDCQGIKELLTYLFIYLHDTTLALLSHTRTLGGREATIIDWLVILDIQTLNYDLSAYVPEELYLGLSITELQIKCFQCAYRLPTDYPCTVIAMGLSTVQCMGVMGEK